MSSLSAHAEEILLSPTELAAALQAHERNAALLALAVAHVRDTGNWADDGSVSMLSWLRNAATMSNRNAQAWLRRARLLNEHEVVAEAAVDGLLSHSQLEEVERCNSPKYRDILKLLAEDLVNDVAPLDAEQTAAACELWRQRADSLIHENEPPEEPRRSLVHNRAGDGAVLGRFTLDDAAGSEFETALRNAITHEGKEETRTLEERQGDALFDIFAFYNKNHLNRGTKRNRPSLAMSVHAETLQQMFPEVFNLDENRLMSGAYADTKMCDCAVHKVLRDANGQPQAFGRTRYTASAKLQREVMERDVCCRFPGCRRTAKHCDVHHIRYWRRHGATNYWNLTLLCTRHHHLVHQQELGLDLQPDGTLVVTFPNGTQRVSFPHGGPPRGAPPHPSSQFAMA